ncbi:MAG: DUF2203 domain-containing protein [Candidatus Eisenbacteria bacterium]|nr:DUF2203 domain-containing protein [Candidatus Eisenbacteria bacterium]
MKLMLFSIDEANRLTEELRPELERLVLAKREFDRVETRVSALSLAVAGAAPDNPDALDLLKLQRRHGLLKRQISEGVHAIHERGALVKDLERGLIDFYALSGDRLIFLCWQLGETGVSHWHTLEGGFTSRQPLKRTEQE